MNKPLIHPVSAENDSSTPTHRASGDGLPRSPTLKDMPRSATIKDMLLAPSVSLHALMRRTTLLQGKRIALVSAVLNVMNCIMGSGILALPSVMAENGIVVYIVLQLLMMIAVDFSLHLLVAASRAQAVISYEELGVKAFGFPGKVAVCLSIVVNNKAAILSYLIVAGDIAPTLSQELIRRTGSLWEDRTFLLCLLTAAIISPLALASSRKIGVLAYCSLLSFCVMVLLCVLSTVEYAALPCASHVVPEMATPGLHTALALPTLSFSFVCHTAFLPVLRELGEADDLGRATRPPWRRSIVGHAAIALAGCMYMWAATMGYLTFGRATEGDIFLNYADEVPAHDPFVTLVRCGFLLSVLCTVPMLLLPLRRAWLQLLRPSATESLPINILLSAVIVIGLLGIAIVVPDIKIVLRLSGATSSVMLVFLLPPTFFLRCVPDASRSARLSAKALFCLGVVLSLLSFVALGIQPNSSGASSLPPSAPPSLLAA